MEVQLSVRVRVRIRVAVWFGFGYGTGYQFGFRFAVKPCLRWKLKLFLDAVWCVVDSNHDLYSDSSLARFRYGHLGSDCIPSVRIASADRVISMLSSSSSYKARGRVKTIFQQSMTAGVIQPYISLTEQPSEYPDNHQSRETLFGAG